MVCGFYLVALFCVAVRLSVLFLEMEVDMVPRYVRSVVMKCVI